MAINWVDRVATHPGRVQLTPVQGQTNIYDMERADEPTVAGTPINAANLNAMQKNMGLDANKTVYVAVSGSDATGNGSSTAPYQTITKALSTIPKNLNGYTATINIEAGNYAENVAIFSFGNGKIIFNGNGSDITISTLNVSTYSNCLFTNMTRLTLNPTQDVGIRVAEGAILNIEVPLSIGGTPTSGISVRSALFTCRNTIIINNATIDAVVVFDGGRVYISQISGSGNKTGLSASYGGVIHYSSSAIGANVPLFTSTGGRIYSGSQTSIPNY